ncbi:hypothetical protein [Chryseobacterium indologenes]|uniref:Uncharacterized protein n=1 Tax=Chryseobacterium indologenes TaxID=253 RepID=A0A0N1KRE6_CHRID|nr:hypothetical protein [Chryseobacterium indologenes]KPE49229.1 hypothetical protein AOB46_21230 [Chryseobacterium indologenes]
MKFSKATILTSFIFHNEDCEEKLDKIKTAISSKIKEFRMYKRIVIIYRNGILILSQHILTILL